MAGNMVIVEGDREAKSFLIDSGRIDDWLYELTDDAAFFAAGRLRERAPGSISGLVDFDPTRELEIGSYEAIAGVEPDILEEDFGRGLGSDPADYPVYVELGTGIFGEFETMIETIPGHVMGPFLGSWGDIIYARRVKGQPGQRYAEQSFEDTVGWLPGKIEVALIELGRRE